MAKKFLKVQNTKYTLIYIYIQNEGLPRWLGGKESPASAGDTGDWNSIPGSIKIPLRRKWQAHSSISAWKTPQTEEPSGLQSMGLRGVGHDLATEHGNISGSVLLPKQSNKK